MADQSKIEWTDATWNIITGCSIVSPGCTNCYAMRLAGTRLQALDSRRGLTKKVNGIPVWTGEVRFNEGWLHQPLRWKKPRMIFVCAHGDLFHEDVPEEWIDRIFAIMASCPQHTFQILTKRPERMRAYLGTFPKRLDFYEFARFKFVMFPLPNVWIGVSVEDQVRFDERVPILRATRAAVRFISFEPLLGMIYHAPSELTAIDWAIVGGESGPGARDMSAEWARRLRDDCSRSGVAFFMKQMARRAEIPEDLQIRQFPAGVTR